MLDVSNTLSAHFYNTAENKKTYKLTVATTTVLHNMKINDNLMYVSICLLHIEKIYNVSRPWPIT